MVWWVTVRRGWRGGPGIVSELGLYGKAFELTGALNVRVSMMVADEVYRRTSTARSDHKCSSMRSGEPQTQKSRMTHLVDMRVSSARFLSILCLDQILSKDCITLKTLR